MDTTPADIATALAAEQDQAGALLDRLTDAGWDESINPLALERLLILGHFPTYASELDWTPREIAGHLRDSARVFTERIRRTLAEDEPTLPDFVTDDPDRLDDYAATSREDLRAQLDEAQLELRATVA
ncbi:MAG: DinB family protein, partial [Actinobacteria bacterium]|nr:DinB family protein [Actinomycetota bacterium]